MSFDDVQDFFFLVNHDDQDFLCEIFSKVK